MARGGIIGRLGQRRDLRRWQAAAQRAARMPLPGLIAQRQAARTMRAALDRLEHVAARRIAPALPPAQPGTDWVWRPEALLLPLAQRQVEGVASGTALACADGSPGVALFHDDPDEAPEIMLTQGGHAPPLALTLDVYASAAGFVSLVLALPEAACAGLEGRHIIGLRVQLQVEPVGHAVARLNLRQGPEVLQRQLPLAAGTQQVEFDLAELSLLPRPVYEAWIDLILDRPAMTRMVLRDLSLARYPRAPL
ncbi:DUF6478 family protein [Pseudoroseicyclus aestuarii]|uniref:Uncharacterized protein n=1 Tax=Pseudoroseicyclus aestuarii TaxID=1795041 RepID=A0A318SPR2_9RHOB|nr:DUF6478 family protein [Pseudoroseicyclus aestuarii]PYE83693.1 hypothetical protein DFP88_10351 [Pseudoroseicyclus aestuarii]